MADLTLPQEPSWKLIAVSPDMMDVEFANKRFPFRWRSSLAIAAFEPDPGTNPRGLCEGRITFLKVTATITGYQPTPEETRLGFASFPNVPTEELQRIIGQYFACYGALLTVTVFPNNIGPTGLPVAGGTKLPDFPHIIDVEPKTRELIQAASETGEVLTSSKSNIKTNKSLTHTENSETGFSLGGMLGKKDASNVTVGLTHTNTETEEENWSVATDASRERQEKQGSTTEISQLYNLLSSYHVGTNRAQFLMLARPHVLQPTDHRTFVSGLRQIEGVQEFILIVARPPDMPGLCVEAQLETGHFPEGLIAEDPPLQFDESHEDFRVTAFADESLTGGDCTNFDIKHTVDSGWVVDTRAQRGPDSGHAGMRLIDNDSNGQANSSLSNHNYRRIAEATVAVTGHICGGFTFGWDPARFDRTYRVFTRSMQPKPAGGGHVTMDRLLITSRSLAVCFKAGTGCPIVDHGISLPPGELDTGRILSEMPISISVRTLPRTGDSAMPAANALLSRIRDAMTTSWRMPQRHAADEAPGFLESDYFKDRIKTFLPKDHLNRSLDSVARLAKGAVGRMGAACTVAEALELDLAQFAARCELTTAEAVEARRALLGIPDEPQGSSAH